MLIKSRLKIRCMRFKLRELSREGEILLFNERAILFGVDVGGIGFSADSVEFVEEVADEGVGFGGDGGGVAGEAVEVFVGDEEGHFDGALEREKRNEGNEGGSENLKRNGGVLLNIGGSGF